VADRSGSGGHVAAWATMQERRWGVELPAEAALGIDDLTRDPRAVIRDQRADDGCDVVRAAPPAARKRGAQTLTKFGAWPSGIDGTRVDRVD
jgi:hypothetical protein